MQIILADSDGKEIGFWKKERYLDVDIGSKNEFQIEVSLDAWKSERFNYGHMVFIPETEYGGIIGDIKSITETGIVEMTGDTWRGMLAKKIIEPPAGQDYKTVSGELNSVINSLIGSQFGSLFFVSDKNTGISIQSYKFDRYCTLLNGIEDMLASVGYRIQIRYLEGEAGEPGRVEIQAVKKVDYSDDIEFSQDCKVNFIARDYRRGINHLICAGTGEGTDRTVLHLYVQKDGTISNKKYYTGLDERVAIYSYTSQSDAEKLQEDGTKRLKELMNYKEYEVSIEDVDLEVGDTVSGRDYVTGILVQKPITQKILKIDGYKEKIEYKTKGDD